MKQFGYDKESEYVLACCLKGTDIKVISEYKEQYLDKCNSKFIKARVTEHEKKDVVLRFKESNLNNFSQFIRNCCLSNPIVVIDGIKELTTELHRIGNNLNQITMLCHQGMITSPDITETSEMLKRVYKEITDIKLKNRLKR